MRSPRTKAGRVVKRTLADGTVKEYRYDRWRKAKPRAEDSLAELIVAYQRSPEWNKLASATREARLIYLRTLGSVGHVAVRDMARRDILSVRDILAAERGHGAAIGFVRAVSALMVWAIDRGMADTNPCIRATHGLEHGHLRAWTAEEADKAMRLLPEHLRRVVVLARYSGQRRGDLCALPWSAYDGQRLKLVQEKTGAALTIPCHPVLKAELDQWRSSTVVGLGAVPILRDAQGKPWKANLLSLQLPRALVKIGLSRELNVHGLRKLAAAALADAGCTAHEIAAVTGHRTLQMVELYTRSADQVRLAGSAIARLKETK